MTTGAEHPRRPGARAGLALLGYRGCGKSSVAARIASATGAKVIDTDEEITRPTTRTIADIFAEEGETGFRRRESQVIAGLVRRLVAELKATDAAAPERPAFVLSLGGGAVLDAKSVTAVREVAVMIRLTATPETIHRRILGDGASPANRPALTPEADLLVEIRRVLALREERYAAAAEATVDTETWSVEDVAIEALRHWRRLAPAQP
jgi:shikimate kinase